MSVAYNTLFEIKRQLGGTALPPYTPLTREASAVLKPEYVAGMGAIKADPELGLQCPICGKWCPHSLGAHAGLKHRDIGGAEGLKRLLGYIPSNALVTLEFHKRSHDAMVELHKRLDEPRTENATAVLKATGLSYRRHHGHGYQNLTQSCRAQMIAHFCGLTEKLGRQPGVSDWHRAKLPAAFGEASPVFKSWAKLVVAAGGTIGSGGHKRGGSRPRNFCKRGHSFQDESNIVYYRHSNGKVGRRCRSCMELKGRHEQRTIKDTAPPTPHAG